MGRIGSAAAIPRPPDRRGLPTSSPSANPVGVIGGLSCRRSFPGIRLRSCCLDVAWPAVRSSPGLLLALRRLPWSGWLGARNPFTPAGYVGYLTQGRRVRQVDVLRRPARTDVRRPHLAAGRHERQHHAVHLLRGLHGRRGRAEPRQPEDRVPRPHGVARGRIAGAAVHGALQHHASRIAAPRRSPTPSSRSRTGTSSASRCAPSRATRCSAATAWR